MKNDRLMVKFIHTSDWHLGMQAHFLPGEARARFSEDRFAAVRAIATLVQEEGCAFVVVAGDVFDSNHVDRGVIARAVEALGAFTVPVFILPGNHDPLDAASVYRTKEWREQCPAVVTVIEEPAAIPVGTDGRVAVVGYPWRTKHQLGDPAAPAYAAASSSSAALKIVIAHGIVDELSPDRDNPSLIRSDALRAALVAGTVHYVAIGDRHSVTPIDGTGERAWYSGTPVTTDYGELDPNQALLVRLGDGTCEVTRRTVGRWVFHRPPIFDVNGRDDVDRLIEWLNAVPNKHSAVVKIAMRGTIGLVEHAKLQEALEHARLTFASLDTWERHTELVVAPDEDDLASLDVSGYARDALDRLAEQARGSSEDALVARDALDLFYRLATA